MHRVLGILALTTVLSALACGASTSVVGSTTTSQQDWKTRIAQTALPRKGCFKAAYPTLDWQEIPCKIAPTYPQGPGHGLQPKPVGGGGDTDLSAKAPTGFITTAIGSFDSVSVTTESGPIANTGPAIANAYSLQVNTNPFPSMACKGSPNPGCQGWEQFLFANHGSSAWTYVQYWLLHYDAPCPSGASWQQFSFTGSPDSSCYKNNTTCPTSPACAVSVPFQPVSNLGQLSLSGTVGTTGDSVTMIAVDPDTGLPTAYGTAGDNAVDAAAGWNIAEFNVFGDGGNQDGGGQASFDGNPAIHVRTRILYGGTAAPLCWPQSFTGETNNLNLNPGQPGLAASPPGPAIEFIENSTGGASSCGAAACAQFGKRTPIALIRGGVEGIHLFAVGPDGYVWTNFHTGTNWVEWQHVPGLPALGAFAQGTPIAVIRGGVEGIHLFAAGPGGYVWTNFHTGTNWVGWQPVPGFPAGGAFTQDTPIALIRYGVEGIRLFAVGPDGYVYTDFFNPGTTTWMGWKPVPNGTFAQDTPIALIPGGVEGIHLFAVGQNGSVYTAFNPGLGPDWVGWSPVLDPTTQAFPPGKIAQRTPITLIPGGVEGIHLFVVGQGGYVWTDFFTGTNWVGWSKVPNGTFAQGTPIALIPGGVEGIHLFAVGQNGSVYTSFFDGANWVGWSKVPGSAGEFPQGTPIALIRGGTEGIHLFAVDQFGHVQTAFHTGTNWVLGTNGLAWFVVC
jgi:hypothetical protein